MRNLNDNAMQALEVNIMIDSNPMYEIRVQLADHPTQGEYDWKTVMSLKAPSKEKAIEKASKAIKSFAGDRPYNVEAWAWV